MPRRTRVVIFALSAVAVTAVVLVGCAHRHPRAATRPVAPTAPATGPTTLFSRPDLGAELAVPGGWRSQPSADFVLFLVPAGTAAAAPSGETLPNLSLDVPDLPFHIPGMIPIGSVRTGYLDDLRKQVGTLATEDLPPPDVGGAAARLVRSTWHPAPGRAMTETALLMVHGDRVYILRARADATHDAETRAGFDAIVRSLRWVKPGR